MLRVKKNESSTLINNLGFNFLIDNLGFSV